MGRTDEKLDGLHAIVAEFVSDVDAAYPNRKDALAEDWPDLSVTYWNAKLFLDKYYTA